MGTRQVLKWQPEKGGWEASYWDKNRRKRSLGIFPTFQKAATAYFNASEQVKKGLEILNEHSNSSRSVKR